MSKRLGSLGLVVALAALTHQAVALVVWHIAGLRRAPARLAALRAHGDGVVGSFAQQAFAGLPRIAQQMPADARVLLVTSIAEPVPFEYYLFPRRVRLLLHFPEQLVAAARRAAPELAPMVARRRRQLAARGQLYAPAALAREVDRAQFVVEFAAVGVDFGPVAARLERFAEFGQMVLYRVRGN